LSFIEKYDSGSWRIESLIGEGSYGKVYKIVRDDHGYKYYAALKVIPLPKTRSEIDQILSLGYPLESYIGDMLDNIMKEINFVQEFKGTSNIVSYEDHKVIAKEGEPGYFILIRMELLESLEKHMLSRKFGEDDAVNVGIDICCALELLNKYGTVHRDVKPDNILVSKHGYYKLGDFGIARQIDSASSGMSKKGTPNYMAPEVYRNLPYGTSVDLYSLGLVMYRILNNGRLPFIPAFSTKLSLADGEYALERRMLGDDLPPPEFASPELSSIILKACAFDRDVRYKTATEMREALDEYMWNNGVTPPDPIPIPIPVPDPTPMPDPAPIPISYPGSETVVIPRAGGSGASGSGAGGSGAGGSGASGSGAGGSWAGDPWASGSGASGSTAGSSKSGGSAPTPPKKSIKKPAIGAILGLASIFAVIVAVIALTLNRPPVQAEEPITPKLEHVIINGDQYDTQAKSLNLADKIFSDTDLGNLRYFSNLESLDISYSEITDISFLSDLKKLKDLDMTGNQIHDASPVAELKKLESIDLADNPISDISPLSELVNLTSILLTRDPISDISPLAGLKKLGLAYMEDCLITDVTPLASLNKLEMLFLDKNQISDVSSLASLKHLSILSLKGNPLSQEQLNALKKALPNCEIIF
jgi:serine/threonine protein kinase